MDLDFLIRLMSVFALSSLIPLTAASFFLYRLPKKEKEYKKIIAALDLGTLAISVSDTDVRNEFSRKDYVLPIGFAIAICLLGASAMLLEPELKLSENPNPILGGARFADWDENDIIYQRQSMTAIAMGFLGSYIWCAQNIFRRLVTVDLSPSAYYSVGIRIILSTSAAVVIHHFLEAVPVEARDVKNDMMPVVAFFAGMFPERAIHYMKERIKIFTERKLEKSDELSLDMIEGVNLLHKVRLAEVGIDNAQNLAEANLVELLIRTPFRSGQLIDWIGQAKLFVYFKADGIKKLRNVGIRTIYDFTGVTSNGVAFDDIADESGVSKVQLEAVHHSAKNDARLEMLGQAARKVTTF